MIRILAAALALFAGTVAGLGWFFSAPRWDGPLTTHFDGRRFHNSRPVEHASSGSFLKWRLTREAGPFDAVETTPGPAPPERVHGDELRVTFVNHATVLVQMADLNLLTDPLWSERCSPVSWAGPRRARAPGIRFEDLPPIDVVLISHNHYDHLDVPTLERLAQQHDPLFVVGLGNGALLAKLGIERVRELDWWQTHPLDDDRRVHAVPSQHFSGRGLFDRDASLWCGFVVEAPAGVVYYSGDTGMGPHFEVIGQRYGAPRLALLPIGAYLPRWFMQAVHISPEEAVLAHRALGAGTSVAVHFGTFPLGDDAREEAPAELERARAAADLGPEEFWILGFGEGRDVP